MYVCTCIYVCMYNVHVLYVHNNDICMYTCICMCVCIVYMYTYVRMCIYA